MPLSAAILAAEGAGGMEVGAGVSTFAGSLAVGAGAAAFGASLPFAAAPPSLSDPSSAPIDTVSPESAAISERTPAAGALTSSVTFSVSSSTSGSSALTASPRCLNHLPTVASEIDSPRVGTRMSVAMSLAPVSGRPSFQGEMEWTGASGSVGAMRMCGIEAFS